MATFGVVCFRLSNAAIRTSRASQRARFVIEIYAAGAAEARKKDMPDPRATSVRSPCRDHERHSKPLVGDVRGHDAHLIHRIRSLARRRHRRASVHHATRLLHAIMGRGLAARGVHPGTNAHGGEDEEEQEADDDAGDRAATDAAVLP